MAMSFQVRRFSKTFIKYEYKWCKSHSHFTFYILLYIIYCSTIPIGCVSRVFATTCFSYMATLCVSYAFTYFHILLIAMLPLPRATIPSHRIASHRISSHPNPIQWLKIHIIIYPRAPALFHTFFLE